MPDRGATGYSRPRHHGIGQRHGGGRFDLGRYAPLLPQANKVMACPLCGHTARHKNERDPITGVCVGKVNCAERRAELDDETIEFLGLVPREGEK